MYVRPSILHNDTFEPNYIFANENVNNLIKNAFVHLREPYFVCGCVWTDTFCSISLIISIWNCRCYWFCSYRTCKPNGLSGKRSNGHTIWLIYRQDRHAQSVEYNISIFHIWDMMEEALHLLAMNSIKWA